VAEIVASSSGPEDDGIARVTVTRPGFQIDLRFLTPLTASQKQAAEEAKARWEKHLTEDVPDILWHTKGFPLCGGGPISEYIDDITIAVKVMPLIDDGERTAADASICFMRSVPPYPVYGLIRVDSETINDPPYESWLYGIFLHEIGHALGFGSVWNKMGLLLGNGTSDPRFSGSNALAAYQALGGTGVTGVPVDPFCNCHWRGSPCSTCETTDYLYNEVMCCGDPALSVVTIAQLEDLGYPGVDTSGADPFELCQPW
jgi:hypothetical protein